MINILLKSLNITQSKANCPDNRFVDYIISELKVDEIYDAFNQNGEIVNIFINEIEAVNDDYFIRGFDEDDKEVELKFSEVKFWIS